ncbi:M14 metallopeptidase family protein [Flavobacterium branchiophilum]|uniref:DUF2817 domain-containing protein n=2 Tax=Flavobacterium branchiophilum TaxID=55197 RepID=A0A2H3KJU8_9FLAO|nr:M14 metallopeptidase family protein [Flavobacterium branchiophilum]PDS25183.1 DUF2817 domain-containing protein [Flavobacterium branchiophilum]CCB69720.1 Probable M14 family peptidase [Flavobacterium branchiophilum FL-15]
MNWDQLHLDFKAQNISGRYITLSDIEPILQSLNTQNQLSIIGYSVQNKPIYQYKMGFGPTKILLWSQMHGNESTTTKGLIDFLQMLQSDIPLVQQWLQDFTFCCIPMLNPDGALAYTRVNANQIDLNRDFQNLSQPESQLLRTIFDDYKPHFCYNLHDQRTIFGVGTTGKPATVSFLAPAYNPSCDYNSTRLKAVGVINAMNVTLQKIIPGQVGRFDDSFNNNCVGDCFQELGIPTILFEAGHFPNDYEREVTRKMIFIALISSFICISENDLVANNIDDYLNIPQNNVCFYDFVCKKVKINYDCIEKITNFASQYKEELIDNKLYFNSYIVRIDDLEGIFGHIEVDAQHQLYKDQFGNCPIIDNPATFTIGNKIEVKNGVLIEEL